MRIYVKVTSALEEASCIRLYVSDAAGGAEKAISEKYSRNFVRLIAPQAATAAAILILPPETRVRTYGHIHAHIYVPIYTPTLAKNTNANKQQFPNAQIYEMTPKSAIGFLRASLNCAGFTASVPFLRAEKWHREHI